MSFLGVILLNDYNEKNILFFKSLIKIVQILLQDFDNVHHKIFCEKDCTL